MLISEDEIEHWREFIPQARFASYRNWLEVIEAGNSQPLIYVEEADNILRICNMTSYTSPFKVVLIWLPEKLHVAAANKLLKIIEEPWEDTRFILVSNDPGSILPTIFSRTQRLNLSRLSDPEIASLLVREYSIDPLQAEDLAKTADGNAATALQAISHQGENEQFEALYRDVMRKAYAKDVKALRELGDQAAGLGREINIRLLAYFARMARENFLYNLRVPGLNRLTAREEQFSSRFSPFVNAANVEAMLADFDQAARDISLNANAKMVMFDTFLRLIVLLHKNKTLSAITETLNLILSQIKILNNNP